MSATCFLTYEEQSSSEGEWEEIIGPRLLQPPGPDGAQEEPRSYCSCGKPLKRVAKIPDHHALLACQSSHVCQRCGESILAGELHFRCSNCDGVRVCRDCGPGVYIGHTFDFFDKATGTLEVQDVPDHVLHHRKARQQRRRKTRGVNLQCADGDAEGPVQALKTAELVLHNARGLVAEVMAEDVDSYDRDWGAEGVLFRLLGASNQAQACEAARTLVVAATELFRQHRTLQEVRAPCKVYGDVHGQLRDLLLLFGCFGFPGGVEAPCVVFNGDFVDRGKHQVEVLCLLFALKVAHPDSVFLNRGNHEDAHMNAKYGFMRACLSDFGAEQGQVLFEMIGEAFAFLPLASLIEEKILVVHGGIGNGDWTLQELQKVRRPLKHCDLQADRNQWLWNLLWSDPIEDDEASGEGRVFGVHGSPRGKLSVKFGWNVTQGFCARNGLDLVIRSHQAKRDGLGFDVMHNESLVRVFSARDYEGHENDCAVLSVTRSDEGSKSGGRGTEDGVLSVRPQVLSSITRG